MLIMEILHAYNFPIAWGLLLVDMEGTLFGVLNIPNAK
jgi:hypothetical protein